MSELQDAIDRFTLALPLLNNPGEGAAQYRDDAQATVEAARKYANPDMKRAKERAVDLLPWEELISDFVAGHYDDWIEAIVDAALGVTEAADG